MGSWLKIWVDIPEVGILSYVEEVTVGGTYFNLRFGFLQTLANFYDIYDLWNYDPNGCGIYEIMVRMVTGFMIKN